jgi:hypothetical protein
VGSFHDDRVSRDGLTNLGWAVFHVTAGAPPDTIVGWVEDTLASRTAVDLRSTA